MRCGLFVFTELGRDVSVVEERPAVSNMLPRRFRPRLGAGGILDGPIHRLRDALVRPVALVVPDRTLQAEERVAPGSGWAWTSRHVGNH